MKRAGVKERIIESASRLFYTSGYNQTGINQIIEEADVAKASMYKHFRSKEDIAVAYLQRRHAMWMGKLLEYLADIDTPREKVVGCFDFLLHWLSAVEFRGCGWQNIITDLPEDHKKIPDQARYHKNELHDWIRHQLKSDGAFDGPMAENLGDQVMVLIEGAIILAQIQKDAWPITAAKNACRSLLRPRAEN